MPRGGARPGAGRPKKGWKARDRIALAPPVEAAPGVAVVPAAAGEQTPLTYLLSVMNDQDADDSRRDRAAIAALGIMHAKASELGKKDERKNAAKSAGAGKFAPAAAPRLVVNNTK